MENNRTELLHQIARKYVNDGLGAGDFTAIPYHENVTLRAPLNPGGSELAISGRSTLEATWWKPLPDLIAGVDLIDSFVNKDLSGVTVEFHCHIANPACTLRIMDRFVIDEDGRITGQENFFDPRDVTSPGWKD
ncbi:MAG: hypothetical protein OEQ53_02500 [Saprospiraceae bacterium]|nr:hypothetical protein [Saprospiraceae bacterium]